MKNKDLKLINKTKIQLQKYDYYLDKYSNLEKVESYNDSKNTENLKVSFTNQIKENTESVISQIDKKEEKSIKNEKDNIRIGKMLFGVFLKPIFLKFISIFGIASTGTPLSLLHGIALKKATLAFIGFGSIATGGGGIILGSFILKIISLIGITIFFYNFKKLIIK